MGGPRKNKKIEVETKVKETIVEAPKVETTETTSEITEQPEQTTSMTVKEEVVIPIVVKSGHIQTGDKVKLVNATTNKIIAAAVNRRLAEKLIKSNPSLKIV